jgi:hypothetical protein
VAALGAVALGVAAGQVWRLVAPRTPWIRVENGYIYVPGEQPVQEMAADGWFGLLGLIAGVLAAVMAWWLLRHQRGAVVLAVLVLGSLVGGWLGWWLAARLEWASFEARAAATPVGDRLDGPLSLNVTGLERLDPWPLHYDEGITVQVTGVIVAQALAVAFTYTVLAGFAADPDLRPNPAAPSVDDGLAAPGPRLSSAPGGPADPTVAPEQP